MRRSSLCLALLRFDMRVDSNLLSPTPVGGASTRTSHRSDLLSVAAAASPGCGANCEGARGYRARPTSSQWLWRVERAASQARAVLPVAELLGRAHGPLRSARRLRQTRLAHVAAGRGLAAELTSRCSVLAASRYRRAGGAHQAGAVEPCAATMRERRRRTPVRRRKGEQRKRRRERESSFVGGFGIVCYDMH